MTTIAVTEIFEELVACRQRLERLAGRSGVASNLARFVGRLGQRLVRPPRVVLLGEFNAGKSTMANALIGADVLPTSIHVNTQVPILIHYSQQPVLSLECRDRTRVPVTVDTLGVLGSGNAAMLHVGLPIKALQRFEVIDTPGLASGMNRHDAHVVEACRRANIAVWCTSSTQAWKASEQAAWEALPQRLRQRSLLVSTKADTLNTPRDHERLAARLNAEAGQRVAGISLIDAARADEIRRQPDSPDYASNWQECGGELFESNLQRLIDREMASRNAAAVRVLTRCTERLAAIVSHQPEISLNELRLSKAA